MKKVLIIVFSLSAVAVGCAFVFGYQAFQTILVAPKLQTLRECTMIPQPLIVNTDTPVSNGTQLIQFGYAISVPWSDIKEVFGSGAVSNVVFSNGEHVTLLNPEKFPDLLDDFGTNGPMQALGDDKEMEGLQKLFGSMTYEEFYRHLLFAQPSQFSVFMSKRKAQQLKICLIGKLMLLGRASDLYIFANGKQRGYQIGNPTDSKCEVVLFDATVKPIHFWVSHENGREAVITQPDLNRMIRSVRWVQNEQ